MDTELKQQVRRARKSFLAIAISYFMGLFNDNFYKEAALLIAVSRGSDAIQAVAAGCFTFCYMLAAAPAGWLADRYSKGNVIIASKAVEVIAMMVGALGIWTGNWYLILAMIGIMGAQSAVFSPAMNGSIPELYPDAYVHTANTFVRILSTVAIFTGMALAGYIMDMKGLVRDALPLNVFWIGTLVLIAAGAGFVVSFAAPRIPARSGKLAFPWAGPVDSVRELIHMRHDKVLTLCVGTNIFIWSMAAVMTLLMVNLGLKQFALSSSLTAGAKIIFLIGIALGGVLSNLLARGRRIFRVMAPTLYVMGGLLVCIGWLPMLLQGKTLVYATLVLIALIGVAGGVDLVPLESLIQIRPAPEAKGRVIAAANFGVFAGMSMGAGVLFSLNVCFQPTTSLGILGVVTLVFGAGLTLRINRIKEYL